MDNITPEFQQVLPARPRRGRPPKSSYPAERVAVADMFRKHAKLAAVIARDEGFDGMPIADQLKATASVYDRQVQHGALIVATTSIEDIDPSDKTGAALRKAQVEYLKDMLWIREKLQGLADRIEETAGQPVITEVYDEAASLIEAANESLRLKGVSVDGN